MTSTILVILGVWVSDCMSYMCTTWWSRSMIATSTLLPSKVCHEGFSINHIDQGVSGTTVLQSKVCPEGFSKLPLLSPHHSELFWLPERTILNLKTKMIMSKNICWFFFLENTMNTNEVINIGGQSKGFFHIWNLCVLATLYTLSSDLTLIPSRWGNSSRSQNPWDKMSFVITLKFWELYQKAIFRRHMHHNSFLDPGIRWQ